MLPPSSASPTADVLGSASGFLDVESAAGALRAATGRPAALQPWKSFFVARAPENAQEAQGRLKKNIVHFQANYLVIVAVLLGLLLLSDWVAAIAALLVAGAWFFSQRYSAEASPSKLALMAGGSFMFLYLVAGTALLNLAAVAALVVVAHAVLHPGSAEVGNFDAIDQDEL
ncbi:RABAC1 [Symbiodinium natans]|uniref:PRA1 family protein n=1 Tax=Symbiodinium natans TaxID=878477 RepID=A0A812P9M7_9DINO|nr:RABAC1 [Symbiodinium natans]